MSKMRYLHRRDGFWHFVRRVPDIFAALDRRGIVKQTTGIRIADDPKAVRARTVVAKINLETEAFWKALRDGRSEDAKAQYDAARARARALGFGYLETPALLERTIQELLARIEALAKAGAVEDGPAVAALLGGVEKPQILISALVAEFESLNRAGLADMSPDQIRKWRNPKNRAVANLIQCIGDKPIMDVSRGDALDFRDWWQQRVLVEGLDIDTANKDIGHLNRMFVTVDRQLRLGMQPVFAQLRLEGRKDGQRTAFDPDFLQNRLLADGALAGLNAEARAVVYLVAETGLRLSEACNLTAATIRLDHAVPPVQVRPDGRRMKTTQSERDIPLVGCALMAMQSFPGGFPRYRDKASSLSATVNAYLATHGLRPLEGQSVYSMRHSFEDRLTAVEAPEKIIAVLMGHKWQRPRYGTGPSLTQ
ncbi:MAG: tyrosine-type recombinase/integrase, partial [Beijerinckiaceae bacterium]